MEDCYLAKATERIFLPLLNAVLPEVHDYWLPWEGVFHNITVISIHKEYPGHARKVMSALWGQGQMSFCKALVLVDVSADLKNPHKLFQTILNEVDLDSDLYVTEGVLDVLDHSAPDPLFGGKLGIDATHRIQGEKNRSQQKTSSIPSNETIERAIKAVSDHLVGFHVPHLNVRNRLILFNFHKDDTLSGRELAEQLLVHPNLTSFSIFALFDGHINLRDSSLVLWKVFNNVDPKRDLVRKNGRVVIDATKKGPKDGHERLWPDDIVMDPQIVEKVKRRATELGIDHYM
jgi:4-hydroxy-3-polyprenylbenzoate decarboxylase